MNRVALVADFEASGSVRLTAPGGLDVRAGSLPGALRFAAGVIERNGNRPVHCRIIGMDLPGLLPEGAVPLEAVVSIKALTHDNNAVWFERRTDGLHPIEALGALMTHADSLRHYLAPRT